MESKSVCEHSFMLAWVIEQKYKSIRERDRLNDLPDQP